MTDSPGMPSRLGSYPVERELGRGGMGVVYLGKDLQLGRPVALKVLPEVFARDPERLSRFEREARLLASLSHPNIAGIYGLEEADGVRFLALEYVDGETLAERLARGPLPVDEALEVCRQIAAAVESAHDSGVIHRDLKPGNVKLTPAGEVKVLDFGLAKGGMGAESVSDLDLTHSPTRAYSGTVAGVILGTAAYMSPEQARGKPVDRRTDIWSFGCVLFECLTGRQAFPGETVSDMIARILQGEPDWKALPGNTPPAVRGLLTRCFEKDAKKRLRDIGEARLELERSISGQPSSMVLEGVPAPRARTRWVPWGIAAVFAATTAALALFRPGVEAPPGSPVRLSVVLPGSVAPGQEAAASALAPDGLQLAFVAADSTGGLSIWLHSFSTNTSRRLPGTEGGGAPFWAPDGAQLGFFTSDRLKKIELATGAVEPLAGARWGRGATWSRDGVILFAPGPESPLYRISANGGEPLQVTVLDTANGETGHRYPVFLPNGRDFTFVSLPARQGTFDVFLGALDSPERERLLSAQGAAVYSEPGYLLHARNNRVVAQRFDEKKRRLIGEALSLGDQASFTEWTGHPLFTASRNGTLCLVGSGAQDTRLAWVDRNGRELDRISIPPGPYDQVAPSPDSRRAVLRQKSSMTEWDLWMADLARGLVSRFTYGQGRVEDAVWSRDGSQVAFSSDRNGPFDIFVKSAGGATPEEPLLVSEALFKYPCDWSPDGKSLVFRQLDEQTNWDLWLLPLEGDRTPRPLIRTPFDDNNAVISPDGAWIAYQSNESGRFEVYVQSFPAAGRKIQVSTDGGFAPSWRADGREILYIEPAQGPVMVQFRDEGGEPVVGPPSDPLPLGDGVVYGRPVPDFTRFLLLVESGEVVGNTPFTLVLDWPAALRGR